MEDRERGEILIQPARKWERDRNKKGNVSSGGPSSLVLPEQLKSQMSYCVFVPVKG